MQTIKLSDIKNGNIKLSPIKEEKDNNEKVSVIKENNISTQQIIKKHRPFTVAGYTYKLKTPLEKHAIYITINNITEDGITKPFEIFINANSENLDDYFALSRLLSSLFRRANNISFIIDDLKKTIGTHNYFRPPITEMGEDKGKNISSIWQEVGYILEHHVNNTLNNKENLVKANKVAKENVEINHIHIQDYNDTCPDCKISLVRENGCLICKNCGWSKC